MGLRKEHVVLIGTVAVLGLLGWRVFGSYDVKARSGARPRSPEFEHHVAPDTSLVLPVPRRVDDVARDLFAPPSDTRPLPLLGLRTPPLVPLPRLRPPPEPGPGVGLFGKFLREAPTSFDAPELFAATAAADDGTLPTEASVPPKVDARTAPGTAQTPEQIAARITAHKKLYDWIRLGDFRFGQIRNPDRYTLSKRPNEDVLFVEFNAETGQPKFPGQPPAPIPRKTVNEFGFADTTPNRIEIRRAEFGDPLPASQYDAALSFAHECVDLRLETPRALVVAEELFTRATKVLAEDPAPRLGLARVHEAGFQFEKAFAEYERLRNGNLKDNPLVLVSLARLHQKFRMTDSAGALLVEAERLGRTTWQVQEAYGEFELERGDAASAVQHYRLALEHEPQGSEAKSARTRLRTGFGRALLAHGDVQEGAEWIEKALQSDPSDQRARAALVAARFLATRGGPIDATIAASASPSGGESQGFDLLFSSGLVAACLHEPAAAKRAEETLTAAALADPLRAGLAWRALSYLADTTRHPEDALRFADLAYENDPLDAWTLYQRGRLLARKDDLDGAAEAFVAALDRDIGFVDALAALGDLEHRRGNFAGADRYLERAQSLDPSLSSAATLRGVNSLELGALADAEEQFRRVLAVDPDQPTARNGLAWCYYRRGDPTEALSRLRELDDNRRGFPEDDPHRVWARTEIERLVDHLEKVVWSDRFDRPTLLNDWGVQENNGPVVTLHDGVATLSGTFKANGRARFWKLYSAGDFVSIEARLSVRAGTTSRVGLFVARETQRGGETQVDAEITASRHHESGKNTLQTRYAKRGEEELPYTDAVGFEWKLDQTVVVRIERTDDKDLPKVRVLFDGFPVIDGKPIPSLGRTNNELRVGIFAEGQVGRVVHVDVDDVEVVKREHR